VNSKKIFLTAVLLVSTPVMVYQVTTIAPSIDRQSPHSDALVYQKMAQFNNLFESTHMTYRVVIPVLAGGMAYITGIEENSKAHHFLFGLFNLILFATGLYIISILTFRNRKYTSSFIEYTPLLLILSVSFFLRGAFLPLVDSAAFFMVALILYQFENRNGLLLFLTLLVGLFTKEIILVTGLMFPLIDRLKDRLWPASYFMVLLAGIIYVGVVWLNLPSPSSFYLLQPGEWLRDWSASFQDVHWSQLRFIPSAFGLLPLYIGARIYQNGLTDSDYPAFVIFGFFFILFWLFTPSNLPRLMFMTLPFCYLFFRDN